MQNYKEKSEWQIFVLKSATLSYIHAHPRTREACLQVCNKAQKGGFTSLTAQERTTLQKILYAYKTLMGNEGRKIFSEIF